MVVGEVSTYSEVLVIGGGPGGYAAAIRAGQKGKQVTLVERNAVGGTCLNVGCIPSKVLIRAAELAHLSTSAAGSGVRISTTVDMPQLRAHMRQVVTELTGGVQQLLTAAGVMVIPGTARFSRRDRVAIVHGDRVQHIEFGQAIIATGSRPVELPHLPFSHPRINHSAGALYSFEEVPESLVVVGGGYIGIELGTAWSKLGSMVTIIEAGDSLLPGVDPRLGRIVERRLAELGVSVSTKSTATELVDDGVLVSTPDGDRIAVGDHVLVCVGRQPNTDDLGLGAAGIVVDPDGKIPVNGARRANQRILAIGDVTAGPALAHKATAEAEVAARTVCGETADFDPAAIPAVVFSDPEIATAGLSMADARSAGIDAKRFVFPIGASARAKILGANAGQIELITDESGSIIGANLAGPHVSELIGEVTLAIEMAVTAEEFASTIHPHPTMSEGLLEAAHGLLGMPLHVARPRGI